MASHLLQALALLSLEEDSAEAAAVAAADDENSY
jgi:hypothetical protein